MLFSRGGHGFPTLETPSNGSPPRAVPLPSPARPTPSLATTITIPPQEPARPVPSLAQIPLRRAAPPKIVNTSINEVVVRIVAEKTGYPSDMLAINQALEGDLGIDSIKRVEIFSALAEAGVGQINPDQAGAILTLADLVTALENGRPVSPAKVPPSSARPNIVLQVIAEKTGYPDDMLTPEMDLEVDLGIDSIKRVEIFAALTEKVPRGSSLSAETTGGFRTIGAICAALLD